jgi:hypothetical protein
LLAFGQSWATRQEQGFETGAKKFHPEAETFDEFLP